MGGERSHNLGKTAPGIFFCSIARSGLIDQSTARLLMCVLRSVVTNPICRSVNIFSTRSQVCTRENAGDELGISSCTLKDNRCKTILYCTQQLQ